MDFNNNSNVPLAEFISGAFGVISTFLTLYLGRRVQKRRRPKDRIETIFDGYDALIQQIRADLDRKDEIIKEIQIISGAQREQLRIAALENERLHKLITDLQLQLKDSGAQIAHLEAQLKGLRSVKLEP